MKDRDVAESLSEPDIEHVVGQLCNIDQTSAWDRVLKVGRVVFGGLVDGNELEWHSRRSHKNVSLRKLVQHPRCPFKKTALSTAVGVYLFTSANPSVREIPGLTPTHVTQVLGVEPSTALAFLTQAVDKKWSVRDLSHHVRLRRKESGERRGRPPLPAGRKLVTLARRTIENLNRLGDRLGECAILDEGSQVALAALIAEGSVMLGELGRMPLVAGRAVVVNTRSRFRATLETPEAAVG